MYSVNDTLTNIFALRKTNILRASNKAYNILTMRYISGKMCWKGRVFYGQSFHEHFDRRRGESPSARTLL